MTEAEFEIPNQFRERDYQVPIMRYLDTHPLGGRAVWVMHRRAGKDLTLMHQTCKMALERIGAYWHVYPTAEQARRSLWTGFTRDGKRIMEQVFPPEVRTAPRTFAPNAEMMVELINGSIWRLMGSDKMEVVGAGPVGVVFSEYALAKPKTWELVRPMLRESSGWAAFISTPRGRNHMWEIWETASEEGWFRDSKTVLETGQRYASTRHPGKTIGPEEMMDEERAEGMEEALIRQEYLCDWTAANVGAVWGDLIEALEKAGAVAEFKPESGRVFTVWDLGGSGAKGDSTAFWIFAATDDGADLLDYYENHGKTLEHYWDEVDRRCAAIGVRPVRHWLPHDARAKHLTGVSVLEQCLAHWGPENVAIYPEEGLLNGIQAGRWLLQRKVRIHPRCGEGTEALKAYHYGWDEDRKTFTNAPEHDWSSHGADAFRGLALVVKTAERLSRPPKQEPKGPYARSVDSFSLDELFTDRERRRD
jgi:phage terminase large subunit